MDEKMSTRVDNGKKEFAAPSGIVAYRQTEDIVDDARLIIESAQKWAHRTVNVALVYRNWFLGKRIAEEELKGEDRAKYGAQVIKSLSAVLTEEFGKGFRKQELYKYVQFYKRFPQIVDSLSRQSAPLLSWTHYRVLIRVEDPKAREWYTQEAISQNWSVRTLDRNISTQYYHRLLASGVKEPVEQEMEQKAAAYQTEDYRKLEFVKNPYVMEFLGFSADAQIKENDLEDALIVNLQKFLLELGKGYAFMGRQYHLRGIDGDYFIDLVFYNVILKCYVLIDLKVGKITHQDVGQMDMYVRMFDEMRRGEGDGPTLGIVLCSETSEDIARYSILKGNEQLFASKYKLYLPSDEELRNEIETQKHLFELQQSECAESDGE